MSEWTFGTAHLLTVLGLLLTCVIAWAGFRSFDRWKREQIEERRMEIAFEALKIAYQSTYVFDNIRAPLIEEYVWQDMPQVAGDTEAKRRHRGELYSIVRRIHKHKDFFQSVWNVQPACMAIFGSKIEDTFLELHATTG
jgi:hypothetical protein